MCWRPPLDTRTRHARCRLRCAHHTRAHARAQTAKMQALYEQTKTALEASEAKAKKLAPDLAAAKAGQDKLATDLRNLQVCVCVCGVCVCGWVWVGVLVVGVGVGCACAGGECAGCRTRRRLQHTLHVPSLPRCCKPCVERTHTHTHTRTHRRSRTPRRRCWPRRRLLPRRSRRRSPHSPPSSRVRVAWWVGRCVGHVAARRQRAPACRRASVCAAPAAMRAQRPVVPHAAAPPWLTDVCVCACACARLRPLCCAAARRQGHAGGHCAPAGRREGDEQGPAGAAGRHQDRVHHSRRVAHSCVLADDGRSCRRVCCRTHLPCYRTTQHNTTHSGSTHTHAHAPPPPPPPPPTHTHQTRRR
jgi:hypothetical protein